MDSTTTERETAAAARRHLQGITPGQVAAMHAVPADTLAALMTAVAAATAGEHSDVREHAGIIAAHVWQGLTGEGAARTLHAARRARSIARRAVAQADAWRQETAAGDRAGTLEYAGEDTARTTVAHCDTSPADRIARTTERDVTDTAVSMTPGQAGAWLADQTATYRQHAAGCPACDGAMGRRVTLTGMAAHVAGHVDTDSDYHRLTRLTRTALRSVPTADAVLTAMGGAPLASRPVAPASVPTHTPVTTEHPSHAWGTATARTLPAVTTERAVTVRTVSDRQDRAGRDWQRAWARLTAVARLPRRGVATVGEAVALAAPGGLFGDPAAWLTADADVRLAWAAERGAAARMDSATADTERTVTARTLPAVTVTTGAAMLPADTVRTGEGDRPLTDAERAVMAARTERAVTAEHAPGDTAPMRDTRRDGGAIRPRPRKGARGGQTGPTVPVRLTR